MPLNYESIGMPMRGSNISEPLGTVKKSKKVKKNKPKSEVVDKDSLKEDKEFGTKQKLHDKKRKSETGADEVLKNKRKRFVVELGGKTKTLDVSTFHKEHEVAKSNRKKEKAKLYKKKSKIKKKNKDQLPIIDDEKILRECTEYLNKWKDDKPNWKFEKLKQIRLVQNMFHPSRVSNKIFPIFVEYIAGSSGHMRELVNTEALEVVKEMEKWCEMSDEEKGQTSKKPDEMKYNRARDIVQALEE